ncbi:hypothetical protein [Proteus faecis]|uniref:hypothetical protein n=1 Tax=Proteus faecis TaxID=2050967 RepID=UPI001F2BB0A8|nr:hypothetical protein [Proteus faecis]
MKCELQNIFWQLLGINKLLPISNLFNAHTKNLSMIGAHPTAAQCWSAVAHTHTSISGVSSIIIFASFEFEALLMMASYCSTSH